MEIFAAGFVAGLALAIPLGPMAILLISTTLKSGRSVGAFGALAMASVDFLYATLVFAFGAGLINWLHDAATALQWIGSAILVFVAARIFISARRWQHLTIAPDAKTYSRFTTYAKFFGLTILNPATAFYFFGITPSVALIAQGSSGAFLLFGIGVFIASIIWQLCLVFAAHLTSMAGNAKFQQALQYIGAALILAMAVAFLIPRA